MTFRDNLLVTMGTRAAYMDFDDVIELPYGVDGEQEVADFVVSTVDEYLKRIDTEDLNFDFYIEEALTKRYGGSL